MFIIATQDREKRDNKEPRHPSLQTPTAYTREAILRAARRTRETTAQNSHLTILNGRRAKSARKLNLVRTA